MLALGRLAEAVEPMRAGLDWDIRLVDWKNASICAGNLSGLELALGDVVRAEQTAEQAVEHANRSEDTFQQIARRADHANALHHAGRRVESEALFREAELMHAEWQPKYPQLTSVSDFQFCDLLLVAAERASWQRVLRVTFPVAPEAVEACPAVATRTTQAREVAETNGWLLDIGLGHLTLSRAALYKAVLNRTDLNPCRDSLHMAVSGLHRAGNLNHLPRGLLTRAWFRFLDGACTGPESAQEDLDEAWDIAERGPMPLFLADIRLHRARLFGREPHYPWGSARADLVEARRLIEKHGYWRRKEELEDAEAASRDWPDHTRPAVAALPVHPDPKGSQMPASTKTILELDLVGYSTIAAALEGGLNVETSLVLNRQIQGFIDQGLQAAGVVRDKTVVQTTGDGAILVFDKPALAHTFATAVHQAAREHSAGKPAGIGKRVFRVGVATGELMTEPKPGGGVEIGGMTIARAVRLEAKARPGEVLCDTATFAGLTAAQKKRYSVVEVVVGKRDEKFDAHRCVLNPDGVKDAEYFTGPPETTRPAPPPPAKPGKVDRRKILELFKNLKSHQFDELLFLLEVPIPRRPAEVLDFEERKNRLLKWADEEKELDTLLAELQELVEGHDHPR
ncbi:MAG TPA: hypothetical protein VH092_23450 [Urbifossiella sp.]|jgi:class 3 adenylate cyclase|nr:hypothetical protein [Urbifossiella sp.]